MGFGDVLLEISAEIFWDDHAASTGSMMMKDVQ